MSQAWGSMLLALARKALWEARDYWVAIPLESACEINMKASYLFKCLIACLLLAVCSTAAVFAGISAAKPIVFLSVISGVLSLVAGLVLLATGYLVNDLKSRS